MEAEINYSNINWLGAQQIPYKDSDEYFLEQILFSSDLENSNLYDSESLKEIIFPENWHEENDYRFDRNWINYEHSASSNSEYTNYHSPISIQSGYSNFQYSSSSYECSYSRKNSINSIKELENDKIEKQILQNEEILWILSPIRKYKV